MVFNLVILLAVLIIGMALLRSAFGILNYHRLTKTKYSTIELTPPLGYSVSVEAVLHYFDLVHRIYSLHAGKNVFLRRSDTLTLEINSSRKRGIRFCARVPNYIEANFRQSLITYILGIKLRSIKDSHSDLDAHENRIGIVEFSLSNSSINKIKTIRDFESSDPINYILGSLSSLDKGEYLSYQMVLSPVLKLKSFRRLTQNQSSYKYVIDKILSIVFKIFRLMLFFIVGVLKVSIGLDLSKELRITDRAGAPVQIPELQKPSKPLFYVDMRLLVSAASLTNLNSRIAGFCGSLSVFDVHGTQGIVAKRMPGVSFLNEYSAFVFYKFKNRLPSLRHTNRLLLSSDEIGTLFHFPFTDSDETVAQTVERSLPTSARNKKRVDEDRLDVMLGKNVYQGIETPLGLTSVERQRHAYIIGGTGNGKTTMMQYAIVQDIRNGKGVAVIDPHGDMAEFLINQIPKDRINDVIYFNPDDISYPIGLNLLELRRTKNEDELLREKDLVTESVVSIFRKIFSDSDNGGHRIEYILRNTIQTALTIDGATLFTMFDLLNNPVYRKTIVNGLKDNNLRNFWWHELGRAGDMQKVKLTIGVTSKIGRFLFSASAKRVLEQPKSTIDFDEMMDSGKILVCNLSKGLIGEDTSQLLGATILAKLQIASLHRAKIAQADRTPFYLYVDEFQNFATHSFTQMLSESRKYKLFMTLAEQSTSQQADRNMINTILANVGTLVSFRTGNPDDESLLLPLFNSSLRQGDIANLPAYNFYMRQAATKVHEPVSGVTVLSNQADDCAASRLIISASRRNFAKRYVRKEEAGYKKSHTRDNKRIHSVPQS